MNLGSKETFSWNNEVYPEHVFVGRHIPDKVNTKEMLLIKSVAKVTFTFGLDIHLRIV